MSPTPVTPTPESRKSACSRVRAIAQLLRQRQFGAAGYLLGWALVRRIPAPLVFGAAQLAADALVRAGKTPASLAHNLARISGNPGEITPVTDEQLRAAMRSYARYWVEAFRLPSLAQDKDLVARLDASITGVDYLDASRAAGKGVIITLTHSGNWDMAGVWLAHHAGGFATVAERLEPAAVFDAFVDYRTSLGFEVIAHRGGAQRPIEVLADRLRSGGIVCLLGERDLSRHGQEVTLNGHPAHAPTGPARLALETGAALHTATIFFTDEDPHDPKRRPGWGMRISPPVEVTTVAETTQRVIDDLAAGLREHPTDWHMLQPVFSSDPAYRPRR